MHSAGLVQGSAERCSRNTRSAELVSGVKTFRKAAMIHRYDIIEYKFSI
jgi:hypothetical protein